ncbi:hypothetical protein OCHUTO_0677 [Orientia chuto str. Dubai]|uniref:Uncharacterized protein n=1 Tax=Orientia chuto str. Dubai TaxID=1359168 RepID=A0A0F3MMP5_9RICK|nr:hypothetical protein [Candidatus Orientia mediorientalis]KJV55864.1 hypothetical protein OCHUTO_0677 [Orientia chuto str. Dubai]
MNWHATAADAVSLTNKTIVHAIACIQHLTDRFGSSSSYKVTIMRLIQSSAKRIFHEVLFSCKEDEQDIKYNNYISLSAPQNMIQVIKRDNNSNNLSECTSKAISMSKDDIFDCEHYNWHNGVDYCIMDCMLNKDALNNLKEYLQESINNSSSPINFLVESKSDDDSSFSIAKVAAVSVLGIASVAGLGYYIYKQYTSMEEKAPITVHDDQIDIQEDNNPNPGIENIYECIGKYTTENNSVYIVE